MSFRTFIIKKYIFQFYLLTFQSRFRII